MSWSLETRGIVTSASSKDILSMMLLSSVYLEKNPSLATFLSPRIGYLEASKIAKQALEQGRSVKEVALEKGLLKPKEIEKIFSTKKLLGKKK